MSRFERGVLLALSCLAAVIAAARNLRGAVTFDEDETRYFELAESLGRHVYALDIEQMFLHIIGTYRPPVTVITDSAALLLMPPSPHLLSVVRVLWVALLLWGTGGLARDVVQRSGAGADQAARASLFAMLLVGTAPLVLLLGGSLMSEVPLAALVACALRLLLRLEHDPRDRIATGLGAVLGVAMLVKWTMPVSLLIPCLVAWLMSSDRARMARLAALTTGVAAAVAGPWYLLAGGRVASFVFSVGAGAGAEAFGSAERSGLQNALYYPSVLATDLFWLPVAVLAAGGAFLAVRDRSPGWPVLLAGVLGPALLFGLLANKESRYLLPTVPAWAALASVGLAHWRWGDRRVLPAVADVALAGLVFAWATADDGGFPYRRAAPADLPLAAIDDRVQRANPGGPRRAAVMTPEAELWTPLWARGVAGRGRTRWQAAWCAPHLIDEAAWFLVAEPQGRMQHCAVDGEASLLKFQEIADELTALESWAGGGKNLTLFVHEDRRLAQEAQER